MTLLPYIAEGAYDSIHSESIVFEVASDKVTPTQLLSFIATPPRVASDDNTILLWSTKYTDSINLKMDCIEGLFAYFVNTSENTDVIC